MDEQQIAVEISDEVGQALLDEAQVAAIVRHVLGQEGCPVPAEVSVSFVDAAQMQELNRDYRGIDRPTDVLSFNIDDEDEFDPEDGEAFMVGDVILCPEVVEGQAAGFGNTVADEARLLLVHGCLHLMGYDHEVPQEAEHMEALERDYLAGFTDAPAAELNVGPTADHAAEGTAALR
jgi:probable rRNA maturation factor